MSFNTVIFNYLNKSLSSFPLSCYGCSLCDILQLNERPQRRPTLTNHNREYERCRL